MVCLAGSARAETSRLSAYILAGEYKTAALEGERLLATSQGAERNETAYLTGLACLKNGDYVQAAAMFEIASHSKAGQVRQQSLMGLGDSFLGRGSRGKAQDQYEALLGSARRYGLEPALFYRLAYIGKSEYRAKLAEEYPNSFEAKTSAGFVLPASADRVEEQPPVLSASLPAPAYASPAEQGKQFVIQVGAFSRQNNASNLASRLRSKGYKAFVEEAVLNSKPFYKVRIGSFSSEQEAKDNARKLSLEGYPTKIY